MEIGIRKRTLRNEKVAYLMWGYGAIQAATVVFINWFPESLALKIILLLEEVLLIYSLVREAQKVRKYNDAIKQGKVRYGKIRPLLTRVESYEKMRNWVIEYRVVCECEGKLYDGSIVTYPSIETEGNFFKKAEVFEKNKSYFLGILEESEIPILFGEDMSYVALEEIAQEHGVETESYFAVWLCGWIFRIVIIGVMIKIFWG